MLILLIPLRYLSILQFIYFSKLESDLNYYQPLMSSILLSSSPSSYRTSGTGGGGSGVGGGTLGRRLGRPFSPAARERQQQRSHSREGGSCMRHVSPGPPSGGLSLLCPDSPVPQIESPVTAAVNSAPPSLGSQVAKVNRWLERARFLLFVLSIRSPIKY